MPEPWAFDTAATSHMAGSKDMLVDIKQEHNKAVIMADGMMAAKPMSSSVGVQSYQSRQLGVPSLYSKTLSLYPS